MSSVPPWRLPLSIALAAIGGPALAGERSSYERAVEIIDERYLGHVPFAPATAFERAAEAAEDAVPWLIVDAGDGRAVLRHGENGEFARVALAPGGAGSADLPAALERLEDAIRGGPGAIPADVDLPVELLRGVARALDRHSVILARGRLERFDERIKGKLTGIGARISQVNGALVVKEVFEDSPAMLGGLRKGDVVLRIDGMSTVGMTVDQCVRRIRGDEGTPVTMLVRRVVEGVGPVEVDLEFLRAEVTIPNVTWNLRPSGVGVLAIDHFSEQTARLLRQALADFEEGDEPLRGVVLDLRGNSGGSMIQACRAADLFLEDGVVLETAGRGGSRVDNLLRDYRAHPEGVEPPVPVAVVVDGESASASEILAGALVYLERAVVIGERTHGKGTVQKLFTVRGGGEDDRVRLKLTVAEYRLPGGISIVSGVGIEPDVRLDRAVFGQGGVWLPLGEDDGPLALTHVDERPGWREGAEASERADFPIDLAERALLDAAGIDRDSMLEAADRVAAAVRREEDARLVETFAYRGVEWAAADEGGAAPAVEVAVDVVDPPVAGSTVEVRAIVRNLGEAPLYRALVELSADDASVPWDRLVLPVGFIPPGEEGVGSGLLDIDPSVPSREDLVAVTFHADRRPALPQDPVLLRVEEHPAPRLAATAVVAPHDGHHRVELTLENLGEQALSGLRARLVLPEDDAFELVDSEALLPALGGRSSARIDIGIRPRPGLSRLDLELRVDAEGFGRVLKAPLHLVPGGPPVRVEPPRVSARVPLSAPPGPLVVGAEAADDGRIASVTAWVRGQKVAWARGHGERTSFQVPVEVVEGSQAVVLEAVDDQGATTRRTWHVRGAPDDATAGSGEEP